MAEENPYAKYAAPTAEGNPYAKYAPQVDQTPAKRPLNPTTFLPETVENLIPSGRNFLGGMAQAIQHPKESIQTLQDAVEGAGLLLAGGKIRSDFSPEQRQAAERKMGTARAIGQMYADRYSEPGKIISLDSVLRTLHDDPVGFGGDLLTFIAAPAATGARAVQMGAKAAGATRVAEGAGKVAKVLDLPSNVLTSPMYIPELPVRAGAMGANYAWNSLADPKGATYQRLAGGKMNELAAQLGRTDLEIVPGDKPTVGEAATPIDTTQLAAAGDVLKKIAPDAYRQRKLDQSNARIRHLEDVSGTPVELARAEKLRSDIGDINYSVSRLMILPLDPTIKEILKRPGVAKAVREAQTSIANRKGKLFDRVGNLTGDGASRIHKELNETIASLKSGQETAARKTTIADLMEARDEFVTWVYAKNPAYKFAEETHAKLSEPVNQMALGQELKDALTPEVGKNASVSFTRAVTDEEVTISKALPGSVAKKFSKILRPDQLTKIKAVFESVVRSEVADQQAAFARGSVPDPSKAASELTTGARVPNLINLYTSLTNKILSIGEGALNKKMAMELAVEWLDPKTVAEIYKKRIARNEGIVNKTGRAIGLVGENVSSIIHQPAVYNVLSERGQEEIKNRLARPGVPQ